MGASTWRCRLCASCWVPLNDTGITTGDVIGSNAPRQLSLTGRFHSEPSGGTRELFSTCKLLLENSSQFLLLVIGHRTLGDWQKRNRRWNRAKTRSASAQPMMRSHVSPRGAYQRLQVQKATRLQSRARLGNILSGPKGTPALLAENSRVPRRECRTPTLLVSQARE